MWISILMSQARVAIERGVEIHWGDKTGLLSDGVRGRSFVPKCKLSDSNSRTHAGLSVISPITTKGQMRWKTFDRALNADTVVDFPDRLILIKGCHNIVFLFLDKPQVHYRKPVGATSRYPCKVKNQSEQVHRYFQHHPAPCRFIQVDERRFNNPIRGKFN